MKTCCGSHGCRHAEEKIDENVGMWEDDDDAGDADWTACLTEAIGTLDID